MEEADDSLEKASGMILPAVFAEVAARGRGIGRIVSCGRKLRDADRLAAEFLFAVCAVNDKTQAAFFFRGGFHIVFNDGFAGRMVEPIERFVSITTTVRLSSIPSSPRNGSKRKSTSCPRP